MHYYTVHMDDTPESEAEDFFQRMEKVTEYDGIDYTDEINKFTDLLEEIGDWRGADQRLFRPEGPALALPPGKGKLIELGYEPMQVRLYCYRVSEKIVILFNGDIKTPGTNAAQDCPRVRRHILQAQAIVKVLDRAFIDREWWHEDYTIHTYTNEDLVFEVNI